MSNMNDALGRLMQAVTSDNPNVTQWGQSFTYDGFGKLTHGYKALIGCGFE